MVRSARAPTRAGELPDLLSQVIGGSTSAIDARGWQARGRSVRKRRARWRGSHTGAAAHRPFWDSDPPISSTVPTGLLQAMTVYRAAIAPTDYLCSRYKANGLRAPIVTSRFGVDIDRQSKPPRAPGAPVRIGFVGQIAPHKGVQRLGAGFARGGSREPFGADLRGSRPGAVLYANDQG